MFYAVRKKNRSKEHNALKKNEIKKRNEKNKKKNTIICKNV